MRTRKMVFLSLMAALAAVVSQLEAFLPLPLPIPGARWGLSNLVILLVLVLCGGREGLLVACLKSVLLLLLGGSPSSFLYSLLGSILSSLLMAYAIRHWMPPFSLVGVSELGALAHNFGQLLVASLVLSQAGIFYYLPALTLFGLGTGLVVGLAAHYISPSLQRVFHFKSVNTLERRNHESVNHQRISPGGEAGGEDEAEGDGGPVR